MTENIVPIMQQKFSFKKEVLSHVDILASLDRGSSLTKIIYVDNEDAAILDKNSKSDVIILTIALFSNAKFEDALIWLKKKAVFPENKELKFHVTGAGGVNNSEIIKEILQRDVIFIDEFLSQSRGAYCLLTNIPMAEVIYPEIESDCIEWFNIPFFTDVKLKFEKMVGKRKDVKTNEDLFPFLLEVIGSGGGFTTINSDGTYRIVSDIPVSGKTFIGLCRCILGTSDYNEIMAMAARGDRRNVDTQIKDILGNDNFENIPLDLPINHLGKLSETKKSITEFNKDDIAHSLVSMFVYNAINETIHFCMSEKLTNVILSGNFFQSEVFRKEFSNLRKMFSVDFLNFIFISNGHIGALGAMISVPEDKEKYVTC